MLTYKFRLYPTVAQEKKLLSTLEACRYVYNYFVRNGYNTRNDMNYALTELKEQKPWLFESTKILAIVQPLAIPVLSCLLIYVVRALD